MSQYQAAENDPAGHIPEIEAALARWSQAAPIGETTLDLDLAIGVFLDKHITDLQIVSEPICSL